MPVSVALTFPAGKFHATPWGHHVNEALPEWPPSPWRLLRALVAVWKRKLPHLPRETIERILSELAKTNPVFHLPPVTLGHTRHYMPLDSTDDSKRTKVFDAFVSVEPSTPKRDDDQFDPDTEITFFWPSALLVNETTTVLKALLRYINYFGRAESWCAARLLPEFDTKRINCTTGSTATRQEAVRVLTADAATWNQWAFKDKKIIRPDPAWNLLAETADLHLERWSDPPGAKWVTYARSADCFAPRPVPRPVSPGYAKTEFIVARFVLDVAEGRRPLPLVTETLPFAEEVRWQLGWEYARLVRGRHRGVEIISGDPRLLSPIIHGKDDEGSPAKSHNHAFYLPTDEDRDGRIDHITIYAAGRFSRDDVSALDRLRSLTFGKEGEIEEDSSGSRRQRTTHRLLLVGLDREKPTGTSVFGPRKKVWVSATPYIAFRHLKTRGKKRDDRAFIPREAMPEFIKHVFGEDWEQRSDLAQLPKPTIELVTDPLKEPPDGLGWRYRSLQFRRARNRLRDDGYSRPFAAIRLTFPEAIVGPVCLGHSCHFGMGVFRPEIGVG